MYRKQLNLVSKLLPQLEIAKPGTFVQNWFLVSVLVLWPVALMKNGLDR